MRLMVGSGLKRGGGGAGAGAAPTDRMRVYTVLDLLTQLLYLVRVRD